MKEQEIITSIEINAPTELVWNRFTDFRDFPKWNPFIKKVLGKVELNRKVFVFDYFFKSVYLPTMVSIYAYIPYEEISWKGGFPKFIFYGDHRFQFSKTSQNKLTFTHKAILSGWMPNLLKNYIQSEIRSVHIAMNSELKRISELETQS
ncbi:SRPBCC domain-containing protein [Leptospira ilyithenensis]|uniref:SRPBCC domain-containing protein n=1 Tax=Leptospira ilyithenensis TaxID=2484901 RepID=A0A4R9LNV5_9LEPT|nr:SRPBCC domain-containing protein [Leptospira ilyithenensis]TGN08359.1 SRPBCC domain-containing protein [Leptospira ilyithenensis]